MQDVSVLKRELVLNERTLTEALKQGNFALIRDLKTQRDNLKNMLIQCLEKKSA